MRRKQQNRMQAEDYVFPDEDEIEPPAEPVVPFHVWLYQTGLNFLWPPFNYYRIHLLYICSCCLFGGTLIYLIEYDRMSFTDALFLSTSATTTCGLITRNTAELSFMCQAVVLMLMVLGNFVLLTLPPVLLRLHYFRNYFRVTGLRCKRRVAEYSVLKWLVEIVLFYFCAWVGISALVLVLYFVVSPSARLVLAAYDNNLLWWSLFHSVSAFSNAGISTVVNNMVAFQDHPFPLFVCSFLILAGYTAFPLLMRFIVWSLYRSNSERLIHSRPLFKYMLDHPRRCFTHLFPSAETTWLLIVLIFLCSVSFVFEIMLDWHGIPYEGLDSSIKLSNMYFQAVAIRVSGFNSVDVSKLNSALLWLYVGMMYISATPVTIALRYTGASRAHAIGIRRGLPTNNTLAAQAQSVFVKHTIFLFVAVLFIVMIEEVPLVVDPNFSIFKIIFEVISAYGPVGLSLGYSDKPYSFSGAFQNGSKLVIIFMMILGKHRGLPDSIDSAISLPSSILEPDIEKGDKWHNQRGWGGFGDSSDDEDGELDESKHNISRTAKQVKQVAWDLWESFVRHEHSGDQTPPEAEKKAAKRQEHQAESPQKDGTEEKKSEWQSLLQPLTTACNLRTYDTLS